MSFPVQCRTLDSFLKEKDAFGPALVKIDTQGAEPGVLAGMRDLIGAHPVAGKIEFTPDAIRGQVDPDDFVLELQRTHHIFNQGTDDSVFEEITEDKARFFGERVFSTESRWVDLLLVPKCLIALDGHLARLRAAQHGRSS